MPRHVSMLGSLVACGQRRGDKEGEPIQENKLTPRGARLNMICKQCAGFKLTPKEKKCPQVKHIGADIKYI